MDGLWIAGAAIAGVLVGWLLGRRGGGEAGLAAQVDLLKQQLAERGTMSDTRISLETEIQGLRDTVKALQDRALNDSEKRGQAETAINSALELVANRTEAISSATTKLATALGRSGERGQWGQESLQRLLERAGLHEGIEYTQQHKSYGDSGNLQLPDFAVALPGNDQLLIDAKFPFAAYERAENAIDAAERESLLVLHAKEVVDHAKKLGGKKYAAASRGPNFVVMYLPIESLWSEAVRVDPALLNKCLEEGVVPVTPATAFALLKVVHSLWKESEMAENAAAIAKSASTLIERIATMSHTLGDVSRNLNAAANKYNEFVSNWNNSFVNEARRLHSLGAKVTKELRPAAETGAGFGYPRQFEDIIDVDPIDELPSADSEPAGD